MDAEEAVKIESTNGNSKTETKEISEEVKPEAKETSEEVKEEVLSEKQEENKTQALAALADLTKLERDIIRQIEYYFSEVNMRRDKFLNQKVSENEDKWVDISVLLTFNRLKTITEDPKAITDAVEKSPNGTVQISEDRLKLRRHPDNPLPEFNETRRKETQARTAYAKGFPLDSTLTTLIDFFHDNFEGVEQVVMRKWFDSKTKLYLFKGSVFVIFKTQELAENFVNKPDLKFGEKELLRYTQVKYFEAKKKERVEFDKKKKAKKAGQEAEAPKKEAFSLPKGTIAKFSFVKTPENEISREDIRTSIGGLVTDVEIAFITFQKGEKEGHIRFSKENDAGKFMEKLEGGMLSINGAELEFKQVEGEEEATLLVKAVEGMQSRRSNFNKGGKGKQHFTRKRKNEEFSGRHSKRAKAGE